MNVVCGCLKLVFSSLVGLQWKYVDYTGYIVPGNCMGLPGCCGYTVTELHYPNVLVSFDTVTHGDDTLCLIDNSLVTLTHSLCLYLAHLLVLTC